MNLKTATFAAALILFATVSNAQQLSPSAPFVDFPQTAAYEFTPEAGARSDAGSSFGFSDPAEVDALLAGAKEASAASFTDAGTTSRDDSLALALRYFSVAFLNMNPFERAEFSGLLPGIDSFTAIAPNVALAASLSMASATAVMYTDTPNFFLSLASAVFALAPQDANAADTFASAIVTSGERSPETADMEALRSDAASMYRYSIARSLSAGLFTGASELPLANLGNLLVDMGRIEEARSIFLALRRLNPRSWDAAEGLAACFIAENQPENARKVLQDPRLAAPAVVGAARTSAKQLSDTDAAAQLPIDAPDSAHESAIAQLKSQDILTSADFVAGLDQSERNKIKYFVENLPIQGSYAAPPITMISQFSTLRAISAPPGVSALRDFAEAFGRYSVRAGVSMATQQINMASILGLQIDPGVDLADVAAHPEKYENAEPNVTISGMSDFMANIQNMAQMAQTAQTDLAAGRTGSTLALASKSDPGFTILRIDPNTYADPFNIVIQKHNFVVFYRKMNAYNGYLYSVNKRTDATLKDIIDQTRTKMEAIAAREQADLDQYDREIKQAENAGENTDTAKWKLRLHAIHTKYFHEYNAVSDIAWSQATSIASTAYLQKIKPTAESMYYDVLRHVALISDPSVRDSKDIALKASIDRAVMWGLQNVFVAYSSSHYAEDWDCDCDIQGIQAQYEAEQAQLEADENARLQKSMAEKKRFDSGEIPESSPLFQKLDAYGTDLNIPFIPFLSGRVSCARTVVRLKADFPVPGAPSLSLNYMSNAFTGASTYGGGVSAGIGSEVNGVNVGARLSLSASVTTDGNGVVSDYSLTGGAQVGVSGSYGEAGVSGEMTFGPGGVTDSDFGASAKTDLSTAFGGATVSIEGSTKRGCSVSGQVEQSLGPAQDLLDQGSEATFGKDYADFSPTKDLLKKELWSGSFQL